MARKKRETIEFRYYEIPQGESALALYGEKWKRLYGIGEKYLHFHNLFEIGYCHEGHGLLVLDEKRCVYESGALSAIPANYPHTTFSEQEDYWEYLFIDPGSLVSEMYPDNPAKQQTVLDALNDRPCLSDAFHNSGIAMTVRKILDEIRNGQETHPETTRYLLKVFLLELLRLKEAEKEAAAKVAEADGKKKKKGKREVVKNVSLAQIRPALQFIDGHYASEIKARDLAEQCSLSETHMRRLFVDYMHLPPMDYVNMVRIRKACELMRKTDYPMDQIASECGFSTTSTFSRNFRKYMNKSPYQWKRAKSNYQIRLQDYNVLPLEGW